MIKKIMTLSLAVCASSLSAVPAANSSTVDSSTTDSLTKQLVVKGFYGKYMKTKETVEIIASHEAQLVDMERRLTILHKQDNKGAAGAPGTPGPRGVKGETGESFYFGDYKDLDLLSVMAIGEAKSNIPSPTSNGFFIGAGVGAVGGVNAGAIGIHYVDSNLTYKITAGYNRHESTIGVGIGLQL